MKSTISATRLMYLKRSQMMCRRRQSRKTSNYEVMRAGGRDVTTDYRGKKRTIPKLEPQDTIT
jgi:hypothetical protein